MRHPFLRTLAGASAVATDPNFENVTLLLHGDGTNGGQNNSFVDGSTNNFTITRNGNTTQGTFSPYGENWSNYFDGTGDYFNIADNAALDFGTGDFTIDLWFYAESVADAVFAAGFSSGSPVSGWGASVYAGSASFTIAVSDTYVGVSNSATISANTWYHYAIVRSGNSFTLYINGVGGTAVTNTSSINTQAAGLNIGRSTYTLNLREFKGYISNLRIVKGTAVYTSNFTPSTTPLTAITNTSLLTCKSNRFRDASTNNFTITRNGDVSVQRFSPFSPTAAYAAGTIGGSGYFDGTGDYLTSSVSNNIVPTTGDFTAECWFYATASTSGEMFSFRTNGSSFAALRCRRTSTYLDLLISTTGSAWAINDSFLGTVPQNAWNHIAVVRDGGTFRLFVNGTSVHTSTAISSGTALMSGTTNNFIGCTSTGSPLNLVTGYLADCRVVQSAVYTANFTPPTAPLTAITNTSLLLNFQNAAILDNAMMAVPETVGNAQIDTTTKKYGTGSLEFDGTGDWLLIPDSPDQRLGTGNLTIECWLYLSATGTARGIVGKGTSTTGWLLSTNTSNAVVFTYGTSTITSTGTLSGTTWYHIAVVREGTGTNQTKIYIDGTNDGTGTVSTDFTQTNAAYVGANRTGGDPMNGYIDDLRITKGVARYTATFTRPTAAFPDL